MHSSEEWDDPKGIEEWINRHKDKLGGEKGYTNKLYILKNRECMRMRVVHKSEDKEIEERTYFKVSEKNQTSFNSMEVKDFKQ